MRQRDDALDARAAAQGKRDQVADTEQREEAPPGEYEERHR